MAIMEGEKYDVMRSEWCLRSDAEISFWLRGYREILIFDKDALPDRDS